MQVITRRAALASVGALAVGTVAAAAVWRKPGPSIAVPLAHAAGTEPKLEGISALAVTDPPRALPAFQFVDAAGVPHGIGEFAGTGIVLNLWATWCVPCVAELPALAALARRGAEAGLKVLPLSTDRGGAEVVQRFYAEHGLTELAVLLDPKGAAARALGARGLPTTLIIDRQGRERGRFEGAGDWASDATLARLRELVG